MVKAVLRLEHIGYGNARRTAWGGMPDFRRPWVARIFGIYDSGKLRREFLQCEVQLSEASSTENRNVFRSFILSEGYLYETKHYVSWKSYSRVFRSVRNDGAILKVFEEDALEWARNL